MRMEVGSICRLNGSSIFLLWIEVKEAIADDLCASSRKEREGEKIRNIRRAPPKMVVMA